MVEQAWIVCRKRAAKGCARGKSGVKIALKKEPSIGRPPPEHGRIGHGMHSHLVGHRRPVAHDNSVLKQNGRCLAWSGQARETKRRQDILRRFSDCDPGVGKQRPVESIEGRRRSGGVEVGYRRLPQFERRFRVPGNAVEPPRDPRPVSQDCSLVREPLASATQGLVSRLQSCRSDIATLIERGPDGSEGNQRPICGNARNGNQNQRRTKTRRQQNHAPRPLPAGACARRHTRLS